MNYNEQHEPETDLAWEVTIAWVLAVGLVGAVLVVLSLFD